MPHLRLYLFLLLFGTNAYGQNSDPDGSPYEKSLANGLKQYDSVNVWSQHLYNGSLYYVYDAKSEDHQFYLSRDWIKGDLVYDGQFYPGMLMKYDIFKDLLVIRHYEGEGHVSLQNDRVSSFNLQNHQFRRFEAGKEVSAGMRTTFYDLLYDGKSKVLARHLKERITKIDNMTVVAHFFDQDLYYLQRNGSYMPVRSKKSVLNLFYDRKKELKRYLRVNHIRFNEDRAGAITKTAMHYDELTQP
jgi:hypothetical protein